MVGHVNDIAVRRDQAVTEADAGMIGEDRADSTAPRSNSISLNSSKVTWLAIWLSPTGKKALCICSKSAPRKP